MLTRSNPNREDWDTLMAECVVRMGLRPEGYTSADFKTDYDLHQETGIGMNGEGWDSIPRLSFVACESNPRTELSVYEIQAQRLVQVGYRQLDYTPDRFRTEQEAGVFNIEALHSTGTSSEALGNCFSDPFYART
jgi:hypothetical protein